MYCWNYSVVRRSLSAFALLSSCLRRCQRRRQCADNYEVAVFMIKRIDAGQLESVFARQLRSKGLVRRAEKGKQTAISAKLTS